MFANITEDAQFTTELYLYSTTSDLSMQPVDTTSSPHTVKVYRDYTGLGTFTANGYNGTLTGNSLGAQLIGIEYIRLSQKISNSEI